MDISVFYHPTHPECRQIHSAIRMINRLQTQYVLIDKSKEKDVQQITTAFKRLFYERAYIGDLERGYNIAVYSDPFEDNWFSHESNCCCIITTDSWRKYFAPPSVKAYLIYQIAQAMLTFTADLREEDFLESMVHEEATGCLNDMCMKKSDIKIGIAGGFICPSCRGRYLQYGVQEKKLKAVEAVLDAARSEALGRPVSLPEQGDEKRVFIVHGHNESVLNVVAKYIKDIGLHPVILKRLARNGIESILNQINENANVMCAVLLFTAYDLGKENSPEEQLRNRARQNVVFEAGFFLGKLGKEKVLMMAEKNLELPSDLGGCRYIQIDANDYWKAELHDDLTQMGLVPD